MSNDIKTVSAVLTLENLGFEFNGGIFWKPPVGKIPYYLKDTPKYVTFDASQDIMDTFLGRLEDGKDYKVVYTKHLKADEGKSYILNNGVRAHESFFYPEPSREDILPNEGVVVEEDGGFDNLVRSDYIIQEGDYFKLNKLSEEQKEFLQKELPFYSEETFYSSGGYCYYDCDKEFVGCYTICCTGKELSFNLLFVEKS